jgi:Fic family protein
MNKLNKLPPKSEIETVEVYKILNRATRVLAELKGEAKTIPNEEILINTLGLQEAKDSSAIENIITTYDDLFRANVDDSFKLKNFPAKEVINYSDALKHGFELVRNNGLLTANNILNIHGILEPNKQGLRKLPGTVLKNGRGETVYTPPQNYDDIVGLMTNIEKYINDDDFQNIDPLIKMPIIHYQFESIHPFYDGNGRAGRVINVLYLIKQDLLTLPVLYLSRYINQYKQEYYRLLQTVRIDNDWQAWLLFMLDAVEQTSLQTIGLIKAIKQLMQRYKLKIRTELPRMYSQDLLNNIFRHPYTKIEFIINDLQVHRNTATKYLEALLEISLLSKHKLGKDNFYLNDELFQLLLNSHELPKST